MVMLVAERAAEGNPGPSVGADVSVGAEQQAEVVAVEQHLLRQDRRVADMLTSLVEGGLVIGRLLGDATVLPKQVLLYRDYLRLLFRPD